MADESTETREEPTADESTDEGNQYVRFDPEETELTLGEAALVSKLDLRTLEQVGVLSAETEERDGEEVVTECVLNPRYLGMMATEFNTVEKRLGERFSSSRWRGDIRMRY